VSNSVACAFWAICFGGALDTKMVSNRVWVCGFLQEAPREHKWRAAGIIRTDVALFSLHVTFLFAAICILLALNALV
jgi:hypothetical protein